MHPDSPRPSQPWWRIRMMWLVIGGPLVVVVAGFATLALAIHGGDRPLDTRPVAEAGALAPAVQARNHVAPGRR